MSVSPNAVAGLRPVVGGVRRPVHLHEPRFAGHEWDYVKQCLDTGWVSSAGRFVHEFEHKLVAVSGTTFAIAIVNGTAALQVALRLMGVVRNDEVIVPALTFVATANAVTFCGATPHFVDSEERTLGLDPRKLRTYLDRISERRGELLIIGIPADPFVLWSRFHVFGHPVEHG